MKKVIVIVGPTASGKTKIAIEVAKHYNLDVISGDSVAVYKRLDIGSAKPTLKEMDGVKHHLIDVLEPTEQYDVSMFQKMARQLMDKNDISLIAGGTGLYIQSAIYNYEFSGEKRDSQFEKQFESFNNDELYKILLKKNPNIDQEKIHPNNRKRVLRALELLESSETGKLNNKKNEALYDAYIIYLKMDREILYDRINKRVDLMIKDGLLAEAKSLFDDGIFPHAIGYSELVPYYNGDETLESAIDEIKKNTRHLAKRQETWFRNQMNCHFYDVKLDDIKQTINEIINDIDRWLE